MREPRHPYLYRQLQNAGAFNLSKINIGSDIFRAQVNYRVLPPHQGHLNSLDRHLDIEALAFRYLNILVTQRCCESARVNWIDSNLDKQEEYKRDRKGKNHK